MLLERQRQGNVKTRANDGISPADGERALKADFTRQVINVDN